jgi:predicted HTH domain antitoxin
MGKSETRTKEVRVLLSPQEKERIEQAARARHRTTSDYLRTLALEDITADAVQQYAAGAVSQEAAASLAGLSPAEFLVVLARRGVSVAQPPIQEIHSEVDLRGTPGAHGDTNKSERE